MEIIPAPAIETLLTQEQQDVLREIELAPDLLRAKLLGFTASMLSPRDSSVLVDVARAIRNLTEPYVRTRLPQDMIVRREKPTDDFPLQHDQFALELSFALSILGSRSASPDEARMYTGEAYRLYSELSQYALERCLPLFEESRLRVASIHYLNGAWGIQACEKQGDVIQKQAQENIEQAVGIYTRLLDDLDKIQQIKLPGEIELLRAKHGSALAAAMLNDLPKFRTIPPELRDTLVHAILRDSEVLLPEVCFGLGRSYALLGARDQAFESIGQCFKHQKSLGDLASSALIESADLLRDKLRESSRGQSVIPESAPSVLAKVRELTQEAGVPQRVYLPPR